MVVEQDLNDERRQVPPDNMGALSFWQLPAEPDRVSEEDSRAIRILLWFPRNFAVRGRRKKGILDPTLVEREGIYSLVGVRPEQIIRECRAFLLKNRAQYRKGPRLLTTSLGASFGDRRMSYVVWEYGSDVDYIRFWVMGRWAFRLRVWFLRVLGWKEVPDKDKKTCQDEFSGE